MRVPTNNQLSNSVLQLHSNYRYIPQLVHICMLSRTRTTVSVLNVWLSHTRTELINELLGATCQLMHWKPAMNWSNNWIDWQILRLKWCNRWTDGFSARWGCKHELLCVTTVTVYESNMYVWSNMIFLKFWKPLVLGTIWGNKNIGYKKFLNYFSLI